MGGGFTWGAAVLRVLSGRRTALVASTSPSIRFSLADFFAFVTKRFGTRDGGGLPGTGFGCRFRRGRKTMTAGTLTRADIAARSNQQIGLSRNESATIVESILSPMSDALAGGQNVRIWGFGSLRADERRAGEG